MAEGSRRAPLWLVVVVTALLAAVLTLGLDRGVALLRTTPTPPATQNQPIVLIATAPPEPDPSEVPSDEAQRELRLLQQQTAQHFGFTFVIKAQQQVTFALEALSTNDGARADRELAAAITSLDEAFKLVPEDKKPQIDQERREIGRIRADLVVNPRGLDDDLRMMRDRLLALIGAQSQ